MTRAARTAALCRVVTPLCLAALAGCERAARSPEPPALRTGGIELRDYVTEPLLVPGETDNPCPRLVSAAPNITELCCALGLSKHLAGRTRYCAFIEPAAGAPSIGDLVSLNVETLLQLRPELILVSGTSRGITDRLERLGLAFESLPDAKVSDLFRAIARLGELTGRPETAKLLGQAIAADLDRVAGSIGVSPARDKNQPSRPPRRVLIVLEPLSEPPTAPFVAGPGSFYDDLLRRAGHANAASAVRDAFAPVSLEFVLAADPEVIVELVPRQQLRPAGDADARRIWAQVGPLAAVASRRVRVLVGPETSILGPRIARFFAELALVVQEPSDE